jgi:sugar phosphate isomerase/epimerase
VTSIAGGIDVRFDDGGKKVTGVDERLFAGCGEAGIPIIRICQSLERGVGFHDNIDSIRRIYDAVLPYCEKDGVTLGVQKHFGHAISNAAETYILLKDYDPRYIAAVWDSGHNGLAGGDERLSLDTVWDMLCMVNFKAAYWRRVNGPEQEARWDTYWTTALHGQGSWKEAVNYLKERDYSGIVCLPAEYSDEPNVEAYAREDLKYIKSLFKGEL